MARKQKNRKYKVFMLVTNDDLELPMSVPMTIDEMAQYTGRSVKNIYWATSPSAQKRQSQITKGCYRWAPYKIISFTDEEGILDDSE